MINTSACTHIKWGGGGVHDTKSFAEKLEMGEINEGVLTVDYGVSYSTYVTLVRVYLLYYNRKVLSAWSYYYTTHIMQMEFATS